jgi:hypothetical protein
VKNKLMGIRHVHVVNGMEGPLVGKPRIGLLLRSLKKLHRELRRYPVTVVMLLDIHDRLDLDDFDQLLLWTALYVRFPFLLRGGEYLCHDGADWDWPKIVRGADIKFWALGKHTLGGVNAEEVSLAIRSAKADIFNAGRSRNHFRSGSPICVVDMLAKLQQKCPQRFQGGEEPELPLFRKADGSPLFRSEVQEAIQEAATRCGVPKERIATHFLRIGGASALIQKFGRWASNAFQAYLWESSEDARGVAAKMAADRTSLTVTR